MTEKHTEELRKLIPQESYFDMETVAFLEEGMKFCYQNRADTFTKENLKLVAMPVVGNSITYKFTDSENREWVVKESSADIIRFFHLPQKVRDHHRINPITKISPSLEFYSTPLIDGFEGEIIKANFDPNVFAEEWASLLIETSEVGITFEDIKPAEGHNLFWDLRKKELVLFDHGSYAHNAQLDAHQYLVEYIRKLFTPLHDIFHSIGYSSSLEHNSEGEIMLSQAFIHKLQTEYLVIVALLNHLKLDYLPTTKRTVVEIDIYADMKADLPPKWVKRSKIENNNKNIPTNFKDFLLLILAEMRHHDIKMRDEHVFIEGKKVSFDGQEAARAFEKFIESIA